jgi:hypothetical protein
MRDEPTLRTTKVKIPKTFKVDLDDYCDDLRDYYDEQEYRAIEARYRAIVQERGKNFITPQSLNKLLAAEEGPLRYFKESADPRFVLASDTTYALLKSFLADKDTFVTCGGDIYPPCRACTKNTRDKKTKKNKMVEKPKKKNKPKKKTCGRVYLDYNNVAVDLIVCMLQGIPFDSEKYDNAPCFEVADMPEVVV